MRVLESFAHYFHPQRTNNHRPHILHLNSLIFLSFVGVFAAILVHLFPVSWQPPGAVLGFSSSITASEVLSYTNLERQKAGVSTLQMNQKLNEAALAKAQDMFAKQYWAHNAPDGTQPWAFFKKVNYVYSAAGENLARDFSLTSDVVDAWMNSPTHKANLISPKYSEIGIGVMNGNLQGVDTTLVVQFFGKPLARKPEILTQKTETTGKVKAETDVQAPEPETLGFAEIAQVPEEPVLASQSYEVSALKEQTIFSPLQIIKAIFIAIIFIIVLTLVYDSAVMRNYSTVRTVGKNLAHISLLIVVAFLLIFFRAGMIG